MKQRIVLSLVALAACKSASPASPDAAPGAPDAMPGAPDAMPGTPDAMPGTPDAAPGTPDAMPDMAAVTSPGTPIGVGAATATIGAAGGTITADFGRVTLTVPAGALAADTSITVTPITNTAPGGLGHAYRLTPDGLTFTTPASLTLALTADDLHATDLQVVRAATQTPAGTWSVQPVTSDGAKHTSTIALPHFSDWGWFSTWQLVGTPAIHVGQTADITLDAVDVIDDGNGTVIAIEKPYSGAMTASWDLAAGNGIIVGKNHTATYSQPTKPTETPAVVTCTFTEPGGPQITLEGSIYIFARTYQLAMHFVSNKTCSASGGSIVGFDLTTDATADLSLDDQMNVTADALSPEADAMVTNLVSCEPPNIASAGLGPGRSDGIRLTAAGGAWSSAARRLALTLDGTWSDYPDFTMYYVGPPPSSMEHASLPEPLNVLSPVLHFVGKDGEVLDYPYSGQPNSFTEFKFTLTATQW